MPLAKRFVAVLLSLCDNLLILILLIQQSQRIENVPIQSGLAIGARNLPVLTAYLTHPHQLSHSLTFTSDIHNASVESAFNRKKNQHTTKIKSVANSWNAQFHSSKLNWTSTSEPFDKQTNKIYLLLPTFILENCQKVIDWKCSRVFLKFYWKFEMCSLQNSSPSQKTSFQSKPTIHSIDRLVELK